MGGQHEPQPQGRRGQCGACRKPGGSHGATVRLPTAKVGQLTAGSSSGCSNPLRAQPQAEQPVLQYAANWSPQAQVLRRVCERSNLDLGESWLL